MTSVVFNPDNLAHVIAALQHYRMSLLAARTEKPFDFSLLASLGQNDAAMMAVRTALNDFRPGFGPNNVKDYANPPYGTQRSEVE